MTTTPCAIHEHLQLVQQRVPTSPTTYGHVYVVECASCDMQWPLEQDGHDMHIAGDVRAPYYPPRCPKCWRIGQCDPVCVESDEYWLSTDVQL